MSVKLLGNQLSEPLRRLLPDSLLGQVYLDSGLNCETCFPEKGPSKCCHYLPFLPNFIVGELLLKGIIKTQYSNYICSPLGWVPTIDFQKEFKRLGHEGATESCVFLEDGMCSIWEQREAICCSYFCKTINCEEYWLEMENFLWDLQMLQAGECLVESGFSDVEIRRVKKHFESGENKNLLWPEHYSENWSRFYIMCFQYSKVHTWENHSSFLTERLKKIQFLHINSV